MHSARSMVTQGLFDTDRFLVDSRVDALRQSFSHDEYVRLPLLLTSEGLDVLRAEATRMESYATRRDFLMESMDNSPRHMTTIGGHIITEHSTLIPALYEDEALVHLIRSIAAIDIVPVPDVVERFVINYLHKPQDVHGAHFDDHPVAFVAFLESPPPGCGGELELVPGARSLSEIASPRARRHHHLPGDCYLLRSDRAAHRVSPLLAPSRRVVLNMAFASPESARIVSPSASLLYS